MIKIPDKSTPNWVYFPKNITLDGIYEFELRLFNGIREVFSTVITDTSQLSNYYYCWVDFSSIPDGEYIYTITSASEANASSIQANQSQPHSLSTGLLLIGDLTPSTKSQPQKNNLIEYEL